MINPFKKKPLPVTPVQPRIPQPPERQKPQSDDCEIEIRKTPHGKKLRFKGKCSPAQLALLARENNIDLGDE